MMPKLIVKKKMGHTMSFEIFLLLQWVKKVSLNKKLLKGTVPRKRL
jgi:hypothetical protein